MARCDGETGSEVQPGQRKRAVRGGKEGRRRGGGATNPETHILMQRSAGALTLAKLPRPLHGHRFSEPLKGVAGKEGKSGPLIRAQG